MLRANGRNIVGHCLRTFLGVVFLPFAHPVALHVVESCCAMLETVLGA